MTLSIDPLGIVLIIAFLLFALLTARLALR